MTMEKEINQANIRLGNKLLACDALLKACQIADQAFLDAPHVLNDLGKACPSSVFLALQEIKKARDKAER